jgi:hypothetical protein
MKAHVLRMGIIAALSWLVIGVGGSVLHGQEAPGNGDDAADIRESSRRILAEPEFQHFQRIQQSDLLKSDADDKDNSFWDSLGGLSSVGNPVASFLGGLFHVLAWVAMAAICGMIVYLCVLAARSFERNAGANQHGMTFGLEGEEMPDRAPGETPADVYIARAIQLARAGNYRDAVAQLLYGAMSHIEREGLIRYRRGLTYRDYLRAVRDQEPIFSALRLIIRLYEPIGFGRREATRSHFDQSLSEYQAGFVVAAQTHQN